jgi:hypothetical protein
MIHMKASVIVSIVVASSLLSSGVAYVATKASMSTNINVSCPKIDTGIDKGWALPSGQLPDLHSGKKY